MAKEESVSRQERKAKKRKLEEAIPDVPGDLDSHDYEPNDAVNGDKKKRKRNSIAEAELEGNEVQQTKIKKAKNKKSKTITDTTALGDDSTGNGSKGAAVDAAVCADDEAVAALEMDAPRKSKKERKAERKAKEAAEKIAVEEAAQSMAIGNGVVSTQTVPPNRLVEEDASGEVKEKAKKNNRNREKKRAAKKAGVDGKEAKAARFIVFIGNLPFSATKDSIEKHFASVKPKSVRLLTEKDNPKKSRGAAFVEFDGYDHMKTCLKLFHHSNFDDGISAPRKINVELSAGGGGNSKDRKAKIGEKNQKLNEERERRMLEENKAKLVKKSDAGTIDSSAIHPSRRAWVPDAS